MSFIFCIIINKAFWFNYLTISFSYNNCFSIILVILLYKYSKNLKKVIGFIILLNNNIYKKIFILKDIKNIILHLNRGV